MNIEAEEIVRIINLVKHYGNIKAVDTLSFSVRRGEIFGILGPNGSGKSTTLRIMLSLIYPDSGQVLLFGKPHLGKSTDIRKRIGALIERPDFYNYLTAYQNLDLLARISGMDIPPKTLYEKLDWVGLTDFADKKTKIFSHGMKQRLGLAQALISDPELIILDEPANGLDPHGVVDIRHIIVRLCRDFGKTVLLSSHILKEVELIADRMVVIHKGKAVAEGGVEELLKGSGYRLRINVNNGAEAITILKESGYVDKYEIEGNTITVDINSADSGRLNALLVGRGIEVNSLVPVRSLEDYYLEITDYAAQNYIH